MMDCFLFWFLLLLWQPPQYVTSWNTTPGTSPHIQWRGLFANHSGARGKSYKMKSHRLQKWLRNANKWSKSEAMKLSCFKHHEYSCSLWIALRNFLSFQYTYKKKCFYIFVVLFSVLQWLASVKCWIVVLGDMLTWLLRPSQPHCPSHSMWTDSGCLEVEIRWSLVWLKSYKHIAYHLDVSHCDMRFFRNYGTQ